MNDIIGWIKTHRWETTSGVLAVLLIVSSVALFATANDSPEEVATATTTTTSLATTSTRGSSTTTGTGSGTTTTAEVAEGATGITAVVVDNVADVGFQIGIGSADLLIETPVEGGLTRFTALYGEEIPDLVGPVRSLRPVSADLLALFRPVVFTTGGQPFVVGAVSATGTTVVTPELSIAFQSLERPQPHHVFVSPSTDVSVGAPLTLPWETGDWPGGDPATEVTLPIDGGAVWRYEDGVYVRYRDGGPLQVLDEFDGEPTSLTRDTLIMLVANMKSAGYVDSAGSDVPTFDVVGGGDLYVFHQGEVIEGTWFRPSQAEGYTFTDEVGQPIAIPDDNVYLSVVPDESALNLGS